MASNVQMAVVGKNGTDDGEIRGDIIKILVVGNKECGKSSLIEKFSTREGNSPDGQLEEYMTREQEFATVYTCRYHPQDQEEDRKVEIYEMFDVPTVEDVKMISEEHYDANGIIFLFAIDDPSGFQSLETRFIQALSDHGVWTDQPALLVGNKKDLREDPGTIQRLARDNLFPVTVQEGRNLAEQRFEHAFRYHECKSTDENDKGIHDVFHIIVSKGYVHLMDDGLGVKITMDVKGYDSPLSYGLGGAPAAEGGVPAAEGGVPAAEGGVPAAEGGVPAAEGGVPAAEGGVPAAEGGVPAAEGGVPAAEGGAV